MKTMLDICSGLGGASEAFIKHDWEVIRVDIEKKYKPDICLDVRHLFLKEKYDFIWASPPCLEYSRRDQPWKKFDKYKNIDFDRSLWHACERIINECKKEYWIIENVRGAQKYHGRARQHIGSVYLWGYYPILYAPHVIGSHKKYVRSPELRAKIPYAISHALCHALS